jgi:uncharacterized protein YjeT (DUF2065 family)
MEAAPGLHPA